MGVAIHTVQIGSDPYAAGRAVQWPDPDAQPGLADMARLTNGRHYFVRSTQDAGRVIHDIGALEKTLVRPVRYRQVREWYWLPLLLAVGCLFAAHLLRLRQTA